MTFRAQKVNVVLCGAKEEFRGFSAILALEFINGQNRTSQRVMFAPHLGHVLWLHGVPL